MLVSKEELQFLTDFHTSDNFEVVKEEVIGHSRWTLDYEQVLKHKATGNFYTTCYRVGATECQDESPYEFALDEIMLAQVVPVQVTSTAYVGLNSGESHGKA